ncbi:MAG TPA: hypothetical protein VEG67_06340, partial [Myxococcota bacterium]|nr:hypothetical protein [Myxococcota bacterium]
HPWAATGAFVLGVLSKASALLVLPVVAVRKWIGSAAPQTRWVALWTLLVAAYTLPQLAVAKRSGLALGESAALPLGERLRETASLIGRYFVIAATSIGVSVQHEPPVPTSWLDSWVITGILVAGALTARTLGAFGARREEAAWWTFAAAGFLPVSQVLPMVFPMADRYLYFILPGAIGALLLAVSQAKPGFWERWGRGGTFLPGVLAAVGLTLLALRAHERAAVFSSSEAYVADAAAHYPDGTQALLLRAARSAEAGERAATLDAVDALGRRGYNSVLPLENDSRFDFVRDDPRFQSVVQAGARFWTERIRNLPNPTPNELLTLGRAYLVQQEPGAAIAALHQALADPGPYRTAILAELHEAEAAEIRARPPGEEKGQNDLPPPH